MPNNKRRLPLSTNGSWAKKHLQGLLSPPPYELKSVTIFMVCVIVIAVAVGLIYNP